MIGKDTGVFTIYDAVRSLRPTSKYSIQSSDNKNFVVTWNDGNEKTEPTQTEIDAEIKRLQAEYDANQYQRDRQPDYPTLAEQFDLLWHAIDADTLDKTSDFYTTLKAVKDAHPKG